jgi:hypothetical protein
MTSKRNRNNAKKSTGPRSEVGRSVSRRNALRHGLAVSIGSDSALGGEVEDLAKVLSSASGLQGISGVAREAAQAQLDLSRIRKIRTCLYAIYFVDDAAPDRLAELNHNLAKLDRYERRALSRRKRALRLM